jgi:hypothetical protein
MEEIACFFDTFLCGNKEERWELYSRSSLISIIFGMQRHFQSLKKFGIINNEAFKLSKSVMTLLKRSGKANGVRVFVIC